MPAGGCLRCRQEVAEMAAIPPRLPMPAKSGWTAGRVIALMAGSVLLLISLALIAGGTALAWADAGQFRFGYLTTTAGTYSTRGYALTSDAISLHSRGMFVDRVRIRITSSV